MVPFTGHHRPCPTRAHRSRVSGPMPSTADPQVSKWTACGPLQSNRSIREPGKKEMTNKRIYTCCAAAIGVALGAISTTLASTTYRFSGQTCQRWHGVYADDGAEYNSNGTARSNFIAEVYCPILGIESDSIDIESASVYYYDASTTDEILCSLVISTGSNKSTVYESAQKSSGKAATGYGPLVFSGTDLPNSGSTIGQTRAYSFRCYVPAPGTLGWSQVRGYTVTQIGR